MNELKDKWLNILFSNEDNEKKKLIEELRLFVLNKVDNGEWSNEPKYTRFKHGFEYCKKLFLEGLSEFENKL
jgi:hypothetical protein